MKKILSLCVAALAILPAQSEIITEPIRYFEVGEDIDDLEDPAATFLQTITDSSILFLTDVRVSLRLKGVTEGAGFASEMLVSLNKDLSETAYLLNQVGVSESDSLGAFYDGWDVEFSDEAEQDVHGASLEGGILTGTWQPDGRAFATSLLRPYTLDIFAGGTGNGAWRLAVADLAIGGQMRLESWSLTLTGETDPSALVPEAEAPAALLSLLICIALVFKDRRAQAGSSN